MTEDRSYYENEFEQSMYDYMYSDLEEIIEAEGGIELDND